MKHLFIFLIVLCISQIEAQENKRISIIDFVEVLNNNTEETIFYYKNYWQELRVKAIEKNYIESYEFLETEPTESTPYQFILITTYANKLQYEKGEAHFQELIKKRGDLKLLNEKKPKDFRKIIFNNDKVCHLN